MKKFLTFLLVGFAAIQAFAADDIPKLSSQSNDRPTWSGVKTFGDVPPSLQQVGDSLCKKNGFRTAKGYTENAQDSAGVKYSKGAFLCDGKKED